MKTFVNKTIKNLISIILVITILNALVPIPVQAETDLENGGKIFTPIEDFVLFLCDKVMDWLQHTFVSTENIEIEEGVWDFKYSPSIIFSGTVPAFDINFIKPEESKTEQSTSTKNNIEETIKANLGSAKTKKNTDSTNFQNSKQKPDIQQMSVKVNLDNNNNILQGSNYINGTTSVSKTFNAYYWVENNTVYIECEYHLINPDYNVTGSAANQRIT